MKVLLTGAGGQLGWELKRTVPTGFELSAFGSREFDIADPRKVDAIIKFEQPDVIINAAAYTAVDKAEQEREQAFAVNRDGVENLVLAAGDIGAFLVHISTDFVFNGKKSSPYLPDDPADPTGVYGQSKRAGEEKLLKLGKHENLLLIRTAWVYSSHGHNFVKTMLRLMEEREQLGVVADQIGTPTWANGLAAAVWRAIQQNIGGIQHWTDAGVASWYDFAVAIQEEALQLGVLKSGAVIRPIGTADYPTPAKRPPYSVLDKTSFWEKLGRPAEHWRKGLRAMLMETIR